MRERRENLVELDPALRTRLLRLDEPVDRSDWDAVVDRARDAGPSRARSLAVVAGAVAALALAAGVGVLVLSPGSGPPSSAAAPLRLALHLADGSGLVLYSTPTQARFLDNAAGRPSASAAMARSLSGGPFRVRPAVFRAASTAKRPADGPLPGDQALVSLHLFTTPGLTKTAGSAVLDCRYGFDRTAYCDGAVDLHGGVRLIASGTLDAKSDHFTLVATTASIMVFGFSHHSRV